MKKYAQSTLASHYRRGETEGFRKAQESAAKLCRDFAKNYPIDVFPAVEPGCPPDRYSAAMARHVCEKLAVKILSDL